MPMTAMDFHHGTDMKNWEPMPAIDLRQLLLMSDDTGLFQHAVHHLPDPNHGYCIDDNCRALIAAVMHARLHGHDESVIPLQRYLTFCTYAFNADTGRFRNFMSYDRRWLEDIGSQDSHARTIWALGITVRHAPTSAIGELAHMLFHRGLVAIERDFTFIRSIAYAILGLVEYVQADTNRTGPGGEWGDDSDGDVPRLLERLATRLFDQLQQHATDDWPWWENELTWGNAKLPHALLAAGDRLDRPDMIAAGLRSLRWCLDMQTVRSKKTVDGGGNSDNTGGVGVGVVGDVGGVGLRGKTWGGTWGGGRLSIVGNDGWFTRDGHRAQFDQQPIEAQGFVQACLCAARIVEQRNDLPPAHTASRWTDDAWMCFTWFRGNNDLGMLIHHDETGGCRDGLQPNGVNKNQGAESVLAYLLSVLELQLYRQG